MLNRLAVSALLTSVAFAAPTSMTLADPFPSRNITVVVPFPPGSGTDTISRHLSTPMAKAMGKPIVIENRPGANGSIGAAKVASAEPDGYNVLMASTGVLAVNPWVYPKLNYDPAQDFVPVINAAITPNVIVVHPSFSVNSLQELVSLAKAQPGALTFASAGAGSSAHLCGESLKAATGIDITHVPYQGPAPALQDVLGGRVSMMCDNLSNILQHVRQGTLKPIAITAKARAALAPDIPTSAEAGFPDVLADNWYGLVVPKGTSRDIIDRLNAEAVKVLKDPSVREKLEATGLVVIASTPDEFGAFIAEESARLRRLVEIADIRLE